MPENVAYNMDCMEYMRTLLDKSFDLAVVDPMYGIGENGAKSGSRAKLAKRIDYKPVDDTPPDREYFLELFRVSKNQIIWGANHFVEAISTQSPGDACTAFWLCDHALRRSGAGAKARRFSAHRVCAGRVFQKGAQRVADAGCRGEDHL